MSLWIGEDRIQMKAPRVRKAGRWGTMDSKATEEAFGICRLAICSRVNWLYSKVISSS